jgi:hypothetical protein
MVPSITLRTFCLFLSVWSVPQVIVPVSAWTIVSIPSSSISSSSTRRQFMVQSLIVTGVATTTTTTVASAACLPGDDLSKECIGVYKMPIDDAVLPYVNTPEALKKFAPDLKWVAPISVPESVERAMESLETQRLAAQDIKSVVAAGRLEEAGMKVLNLIPRVTTAGRRILVSRQQQLSSVTVIEELQTTKLQDQLDMVLGYWGKCDVEIGQALRGKMGVSAVAQILVLSSLRDAMDALDDFVILSSATLKLPNKKPY